MLKSIARIREAASSFLANETSFHVFSHSPEKFPRPQNNIEFPNSTCMLIEKLNEYEKNQCTKVLQSSEFPKKAIGSQNGFVFTVLEAYNGHHNLIIRPDDIWAAITTQFSFYINKHSEIFRGKFVDFVKRKELILYIDSLEADVAVKQFVKEIEKNLVDPEVKSWILPSFSTTTKNDMVTVGIAFMASMKKYFEYSCTVFCGIPQITLKGTVKDWKNILRKLEKLKEYELQEWYGMLKYIIEQFINAKERNIDKDFWKKIINFQEGSGDPALTGWITAFCVFDENGNKNEGAWPSTLRMDNMRWRDNVHTMMNVMMKKVPTGIVEVNMKVNEGERSYQTVLLAGHMATEVKDDGVTLAPYLGWALALKSEKE